MKEYRIVDDGLSLTVGLVDFDPTNQPVTVNFAIQGDTLPELVNIVAQIRIALKLPVLQLQGSGCEVIRE
jgi:hypothetical protein